MYDSAVWFIVRFHPHIRTCTPSIRVCFSMLSKRPAVLVVGWIQGGLLVLADSGKFKMVDSVLRGRSPRLQRQWLAGVPIMFLTIVHIFAVLVLDEHRHHAAKVQLALSGPGTAGAAPPPGPRPGSTSRLLL